MGTSRRQVTFKCPPPPGVLEGAICLDDSLKFTIYHCTRLKVFRHECANLNRIAADKSHSVIVAFNNRRVLMSNTPGVNISLGRKCFKVYSLNSGKVEATPILKSVPSQFSPFILFYSFIRCTLTRQFSPKVAHKGRDKEKITAIYCLWMVDNKRGSK